MPLRTEIEKELLLIIPFDGMELLCINSAKNWLNSGVDLFRVEKPNTPAKHLVCYTPLIDGDHVLLIDHISSGLWLPPGGHVEPNEHPRAAAMRELKEEIFVDAFIDNSPAFLSENVFTTQVSDHIDIVFWYILSGNRYSHLNYNSSEINGVHWFHKDDIPYNRADINMGRFIDKLYNSPALPLT